MARRCNLLFTTAMLAGLCMSGIEPASAQKSPSISPPNISPMRPDFNTRAPNSLRDRDVFNPGEVEVPNKKANRRRAVQEEDYRKRAEPLPRVQRAKASKLGKKTKSAPASVANVVSDRVLKTGSKISGGWREYAADRSWRRVVFTLDGQVATIVFSDGMPGSLSPAVTRFARSGPGPKGSPATYHELRIFPGTTPGIRDKAKQSSLIPSDVATRIRGLGVDFRLLQQLMDDKRLFAELGSAFDAKRNPAGAGGFFSDRPGGSPGEGNWSAPWRGAGRDGRASDDVITVKKESTDENGNRSTIVETRHGDGSTTTVRGWYGTDGSSSTTSEDRDARGNVTGGSETTSATSERGTNTTIVGYVRDTNTGQEHSSALVISPDGSSYRVSTIRDPNSLWYSTIHRGTTPSESGGRGFFDEAWLSQSLPWLMDAIYLQWKRESDLVQSGGRISQPGEQSTLILNEGPAVGAEAVVNCGATDSNPCRRPAGVAVDPRRGFGNISQPGRGGEPGAPAGTGPRPPIPQPQ